MSDAEQIDGGSAFPRGVDCFGCVRDGMTLRDYFAGQVLAGYASDHRLHEQFAHHAYKVADAMLEERKKRT